MKLTRERDGHHRVSGAANSEMRLNADIEAAFLEEAVMGTAFAVDLRSSGVRVLQAAPPNRRPNKTRLKTKVEKKQAFDAQSFLDSVGVGRNVHKFRAKETVFTQGDPAKVMSIQEGGVKLTVVNETGKEAVVAILGPRDFFGEAQLDQWNKTSPPVTARPANE